MYISGFCRLDHAYDALARLLILFARSTSDVVCCNVPQHFLTSLQHCIPVQIFSDCSWPPLANDANWAYFLKTARSAFSTLQFPSATTVSIPLLNQLATNCFNSRMCCVLKRVKALYLFSRNKRYKRLSYSCLHTAALMNPSTESTSPSGFNKVLWEVCHFVSFKFSVEDIS